MAPYRDVLEAEDGTFAVAKIEYEGLTEDQAIQLACRLAQLEAGEFEAEIEVDESF